MFVVTLTQRDGFVWAVVEFGADEMVAMKAFARRFLALGDMAVSIGRVSS